jgi:hypothetical protein
LCEGLHLYGHASQEWSDQAIRKIDSVVNSYADAYRAQIHRRSGRSEGVRDLAEVKSDLNILRNWSLHGAAVLHEGAIVENLPVGRLSDAHHAASPALLRALPVPRETSLRLRDIAAAEELLQTPDYLHR